VKNLSKTLSLTVKNEREVKKTLEPGLFSPEGLGMPGPLGQVCWEDIILLESYFDYSSGEYLSFEE
jgi:hypothetical protein